LNPSILFRALFLHVGWGKSKLFRNSYIRFDISISIHVDTCELYSQWCIIHWGSSIGTRGVNKCIHIVAGISPF
jgi:hypothetical protein